jgi:hypothetical protein
LAKSVITSQTIFHLIALVPLVELIVALWKLICAFVSASTDKVRGVGEGEDAE